MLILDWRHPFLYCGSLGNVTGCAFATEYIRDKLGIDVGVIVGNYHSDVWNLCVPQNQIFFVEPNEQIKVCSKEGRKNNSKLYHWIQNPVECAGFHMPDSDLVDPKICWFHSRNSRRILLYPREYNNQNTLFTIDYWRIVLQRLREHNWTVACILDDDVSHRDGEISLNWCDEFRSMLMEFDNCEYIFPSTIGGLQAGVGLCEVAFGILSGPFWVMLKSTIRQIVISDPNDLILSHNATYNLKFIKKCTTHILGTSLDWISEL